MREDLLPPEKTQELRAAECELHAFDTGGGQLADEIIGIGRLKRPGTDGQAAGG